MKVGDLVVWNGNDTCIGKAGIVVGIKPRDPASFGDPWRKRHLVRWFDTWDLDPLGYHFEELRIVSRVCDT